jgi:hypothetical protein
MHFDPAHHDLSEHNASTKGTDSIQNIKSICTAGTFDLVGAKGNIMVCYAAGKSDGPCTHTSLG